LSKGGRVASLCTRRRFSSEEGGGCRGEPFSPFDKLRDHFKSHPQGEENIPPLGGIAHMGEGGRG